MRKVLSSIKMKRLFCNYALVIMHSSGVFFKRYFMTYDDMDDYAIYLQFTPVVKKAWALEKKKKRWVRCFTLG